MSNIIPFDFDGHQIRVVADDSGEPWFSANEVCEVLGFANPHDAVARHVDSDDLGKREAIDALGRKQLTNHVNESGLYALIFGSTKTETKRFKKWVTSEVLPSIRKTGSYAMPKAARPADTSGLPQYRLARALELAAKTADRILAQLPSLGERARQVVLAKIINPVAGTEVLALPHVAEKHHKAGEVGEMLGITGVMVGRIANQHNLKTPDYGEFRLDKSEHSAKQVEAFVYNQAGVDAIRQHLEADQARRAEEKAPKARRAAAPAHEPQGALL